VSGAGAEQARTPQDLGSRVGEVRQVVEGFLADEVVTVGVADGERQPQHPADPALPFWAVVALGGVGGGRGLDQGVVRTPVAAPVMNQVLAMVVWFLRAAWSTGRDDSLVDLIPTRRRHDHGATGAVHRR